MEMIARPCLRAKGTSSGSRAMVPSSRAISTMAAAGRSPASRARSTPASVCPARTSTPPGRARSGKTCPGRTKSAASAVGVGEQPDGGGPVGGGDAGADAVRGARVDRDGERGAHRLGVVAATICGRSSRSRSGASMGDADQPAALGHHERDDLGGDPLGGDDQVALVLPVLVVDDHDGRVRRRCRRSARSTGSRTRSASSYHWSCWSRSCGAVMVVMPSLLPRRWRRCAAGLRWTGRRGAWSAATRRTCRRSPGRSR